MFDIRLLLFPFYFPIFINSFKILMIKNVKYYIPFLQTSNNALKCKSAGKYPYNRLLYIS